MRRSRFPGLLSVVVEPRNIPEEALGVDLVRLDEGSVDVEDHKIHGVLPAPGLSQGKDSLLLGQTIGGA